MQNVVLQMRKPTEFRSQFSSFLPWFKFDLNFSYTCSYTTVLQNIFPIIFNLLKSFSSFGKKKVEVIAVSFIMPQFRLSYFVLNDQYLESKKTSKIMKVKVIDISILRDYFSKTLQGFLL